MPSKLAKHKGKLAAIAASFVALIGLFIAAQAEPSAKQEKTSAAAVMPVTHSSAAESRNKPLDPSPLIASLVEKTAVAVEKAAKSQPTATPAVVAALATQALPTVAGTSTTTTTNTTAPAMPQVQVSPKPLTSKTMLVQSDRMAILMQERNQILNERVKWATSGDKTVLARIDADLHAIDREIAAVSKQPIQANSPPPAARATESRRNVSAAQAVVSESQPAKAEYESWDVFKNFGKKGKPDGIE